MDKADYETVPLSTNPEFIAMLERSRARGREEGGFSTEAMRKMFEKEEDQQRTAPPRLEVPGEKRAACVNKQMVEKQEVEGLCLDQCMSRSLKEGVNARYYEIARHAV